jgi:hypothetical protein
MSDQFLQTSTVRSSATSSSRWLVARAGLHDEFERTVLLVVDVGDG